MMKFDCGPLCPCDILKAVRQRIFVSLLIGMIDKHSFIAVTVAVVAFITLATVNV